MSIKDKIAITDDMTLEEKLSIIEQAIANAQAEAAESSANGQISAPIDPADLTMCEGCQ
ncbi:MAG: hypothetical protein ABI397_00110 [Candidatus Saccharimonas sp.]